MDFEKFFRRRMKRLRRNFIEPLEQSRAVQALWKTMGTQGMLIHMARQGRWNPWLSFGLCLGSLGALMGVLRLVTYLGTPWWAWFFGAPVVILSAFVHYALWKAAGHMKSGLWALMLRLYVIPMLTLLFFLVIGVIVVGISWALSHFFEGLKSAIVNA